MGLVVTGNGASCNTWNISQSVCFRKYSINGVEKQSKMVRTLILSLAQELRSTFGKIPKKVGLTSEQVVKTFRGKLYQFYIFFCAWWTQIYASIRLFFISARQHFKTTYFSIDFLLNKLVPFIYIVLCEYLKCCPQLPTHARGITN